MPAFLSHPSVLAAKRLDAVLAELRAAQKRIVFTNGCFDILHPGHVDLLARARALGDVLMLGLNSDASVRRQGKGPGRPVVAEDARAFVLAHLESVDYVVLFDEDTPLELIRRIRPDVLVKGGDWTPDRIVGRDVVEARSGKVFSLPLIAGWSTTAIVEAIRTGAGAEPGPTAPADR